jgi:hypothetical protein
MEHELSIFFRSLKREACSRAQKGVGPMFCGKKPFPFNVYKLLGKLMLKETRKDFMSQGKVKYAYQHFSPPGDRYLCRVVCGLPSLDPRFELLPPCFITDTGHEFINSPYAFQPCHHSYLKLGSLRYVPWYIICPFYKHGYPMIICYSLLLFSRWTGY